MNEYPDAAQRVKDRWVVTRHEKARAAHPLEAQPGPPYYSPASMLMPMMVSLWTTRQTPADFEIALADLEGRIAWYGHESG